MRAACGQKNSDEGDRSAAAAATPLRLRRLHPPSSSQSRRQCKSALPPAARDLLLACEQLGGVRAVTAQLAPGAVERRLAQQRVRVVVRGAHPCREIGGRGDRRRVLPASCERGSSGVAQHVMCATLRLPRGKPAAATMRGETSDAPDKVCEVGGALLARVDPGQDRDLCAVATSRLAREAAPGARSGRCGAGRNLLASVGGGSQRTRQVPRVRLLLRAQPRGKARRVRVQQRPGAPAQRLQRHAARRLRATPTGCGRTTARAHTL